VIGEQELDLPGHDVAPSRELAPVVRQTHEQWRHVQIGGVRLETNGVPALEVLQADVQPVQPDRL
jgi:hypothetical protein